MLVTALVLSPFALAAILIAATIIRRAGRLAAAAVDDQA